jgi:CO dehydrogenase maturation factor
VDVLIVVTDPTVRGVTAAASIIKLADELQINVGQTLLVVNRASGELPPTLRAQLDQLPAELAAVIPNDPAVGALDAEGQPLIMLAAESPALAAVEALAGQLLAHAAGVSVT